MAQGQRNNQTVVPQAREALDRLAFETASELGIQWGGYLGDIPARQAGAVGGHMVKKMIALAEQQLSGTTVQPR